MPPLNNVIWTIVGILALIALVIFIWLHVGVH